MRSIPSVGGVLLLTLTGCPKPDDGATDPSSTGADTSADTSADTTSSPPASTTTDPTTSGGTTLAVPDTTDDTGTTAATSGTTGDDPACPCFSPSGSGGEFMILCPAPAKASVSVTCADTCTYDEAELTAALTLLAAGEPGIVTWSVDETAFLTPSQPRALATAASCSGQFCSGGIHILTGDGKVYTQELEYDDLSGVISPLVGATLRDATYFNMCAQNPDLAARFACIRDAAVAPTLGECVPGDDLGYF